MVLGTAKYRTAGGINLYFKYRIEAVVELYKSGKIDFILVSGDNSTKYYNEPEAFKKEFIKRGIPADKIFLRSEEHTSELQSRPHLVCRLLLEKKNQSSYTASSCRTSDRASTR